MFVFVPTLRGGLRWNKNGHKTDVASRPGSVFAILDLENPRKCVERRKNTRVGVDAVDGDGNLW